MVKRAITFGDIPPYVHETEEPFVAEPPRVKRKTRKKKRKGKAQLFTVDLVGPGVHYPTPTEGLARYLAHQSGTLRNSWPSLSINITTNTTTDESWWR